MLTSTSNYAVIAMSTMARNISRLPLTARELAELGDVPTNYLSKIMRQLVRARLIEGTRGIGGGFRFAKSPSQIRLADIVDLFEDLDRPRICPFGHGTCDDSKPCAVHDKWGGVRTNFLHVLSSITLAAAVRDPDGKTKAKAKRLSARKPARGKQAVSRARRKTRR